MRRARRRARLPALVSLLLAWPLGAAAQPARIAIILDDIGYNRGAGSRAIALPGAVAVAILPHTAHGAQLAEEAHAGGKEVLLHLPMQAQNESAGPGELALEQTRAERIAALIAGIAAVPYAAGVSNHKGSLLTTDAAAMRELMIELRSRALFFIDSYTTHLSVALNEARAQAVPALRRHVFLDADPAPEAIEREWHRLIGRAREHGFAIAIGHPHDATLDWLEAALPALDRGEVQLVTLASLLAAESGQFAAAGKPSRHEP